MIFMIDMITVLPRLKWTLRTVAAISMILGITFMFGQSWYEDSPSYTVAYSWVFSLFPGIGYLIASIYLLVGISAYLLQRNGTAPFVPVLVTLALFTGVQFVFALSLFKLVGDGYPGAYIGAVMWLGYAVQSMGSIYTPVLSKKEKTTLYSKGQE